MRAGRPVKSYTATFDPTIRIAGLSRQPDGRWRVIRDGRETRFSEADERKAVERAQKLLGLSEPVESVTVSTRFDWDETYGVGVDTQSPSELKHVAGDGMHILQKVSPKVLWPWLRDLILNQPEYLAKMTGVPAVAGLRHMEAPRDNIRVSEVWDYYAKENKSKNKSATKRIWDGLIEFTGAKTLGGLSKDALHLYREKIENDPNITSGGTKQWMYGKVKAVLSFAQKSPVMDAKQITECLDRCKVLWTASEIPSYKPAPIDRDNLHSLLKVAGNGPWRAWILMGLNCAMYIEELSDLKWEHIDLKAGTLSMLREKTKFPRAATLWPETIEAIKSIRRGPVYVFTSPHGTRFQSAQSRCNEFAKLRAKAKDVPADLGFSALRDGAFTTACKVTAGDGRIAKILAGHAAGMEDAYVLRNPEIVKPACDAVYAHYGPF